MAAMARLVSQEVEVANEPSARRSSRLLGAPAYVFAACAFCGLVAWGGYEHLLATRSPTPSSMGYVAYQMPPSVVGIPRVPTMQAPQQVPQFQPPQVQPAQVQVQPPQVPLETMPSMATPRDSPSFMGALPVDVSAPNPQGPGPLTFFSVGAMLAALGTYYTALRMKHQGSERQQDLEMGMLSAAAVGSAFVTPTRVLQRSPVPVMSAADATWFVKDSCKGTRKSKYASRTKRVSTIKMMPAQSVKDLRERVGSVKNTKKITSAMKLVAAAKVRRAQDAVIRSRPFSETLEAILGGLLKRMGKEGVDSPLLTPRPVKKVLIVLMTGDRGLCGGYNTYAIKKAEDRIAQLKKTDTPFDLVCIGNKGNTYMKKRYNVVASYQMGNAPTADESTKIADFLLASYLDADVDRVELIYTNFVSMVASVPSIRTMLPLSPSGIEAEGDEIFRLTSAGGDFSMEKKSVEKAEPAVFPADMIFEQEPEKLLRAVLPLYFNGQVLRQRQECVASELAARMQAMQSASDNASELIGVITQQMNRQRQAAITQEISEIVAGANC